MFHPEGPPRTAGVHRPCIQSRPIDKAEIRYVDLCRVPKAETTQEIPSTPPLNLKVP